MRHAFLLISLRFRRSWKVMLLLATISTGIGWLWWHFDMLSISDDDRNAYDDGVKKFTNKDWFPWGQTPRARDIIVVAIDDKTFIDIKTFAPWRLRYGSWPYDRVIYSDVFEYLKEAGAKSVLFDATLDEPKSDPTGDIALGQTITEQGLPVYLGFNVIPKIDALPTVTAVNHPPVEAHPRATADALAETASDVDAGAADEFPDSAFDDESAAKEEDPAKKAARLERVASLYAFPVEVRGGLELPTFEKVPVHDEKGTKTDELSVYPVPAIEPMLDSVSGWGTVILEEDEDGKMRKTKFAYSDGANTYVTLPVAAAADALHADKVILEPGKLTLGSTSIHINDDGSAWIDYGGTLSERYRSISLVDVLRARKLPEMKELFRDKYVFIGGYALGTGDVKATPLEAQTPGVAKQLAVFEGLMGRGFITDAPLWVSLLFTFMLCLFSTALVLVIRNVFIDIGWPVILYTSFFVLTGTVLMLTKVHLLTALPSFAGTIASVMATVYERLFADRQRERMKEQFAAYMESDLVERMVESHELPKLEGESMQITAFFSDIKGFSTFSERFRDDPRGLMRLLNRYLSAVTPVLTGEGACIDKYIGDAVVALFGAPVRHDDHAIRACTAALGVQQVLGPLREAFAAEGLPDVYTRIGLNTDTMLVGNIGSEQLIDYTAIGDGMNLAARLEGANKQYGTLILMGEGTYLAVKHSMVAREVDLVRVAGKHLATRIYELIGHKGAVDAAKLELVALYERALELFRARDFAQTLQVLERALALDAHDGPSLALKVRAERFLMSAPPLSWDGVAELEK